MDARVQPAEFPDVETLCAELAGELLAELEPWLAFDAYADEWDRARGLGRYEAGGRPRPGLVAAPAA